LEEGLLPGAPRQQTWASVVSWLALDALASYVFWVAPWSLNKWGVAAAAVALAGWRVVRFSKIANEEKLPYTVTKVASGSTTVYLVGTLHVSPRCPGDVRATLEATKSHVALIELDEERLRRRVSYHGIRTEDAQEVSLQPDGETMHLGRGWQASDQGLSTDAARAVWNRRWASQTVTGVVRYDPDNPHGREPWAPGSLAGHFALIDRGDPFPLAKRAWHAGRAGAVGLVVISDRAMLPVRIVQERVLGRLRTAVQQMSGGDPPVPVLMLSQDAGAALKARAQAGHKDVLSCLFRGDEFPARSLAAQLCQDMTLLCSGVAVLYGIMECAGVEAGGEFTAADEMATQLGIPCVCMDVDLDRLCSRLGRSLLPTPLNVWNAVRLWLGFPRFLVTACFPGTRRLDLLGSVVLHVAAFKLRTWAAFALALVVTTQVCRVSGFFFSLIVGGVGEVATAGNVVDSAGRGNFEDTVNLLMVLFIWPQVATAVLFDRDEAMYQAIAARAASAPAGGEYRMTAVCGAAHANGILSKIAERGLS